MIEYSEDQLVQTGEITNIESVYAVALYDPKDGIIRHIHQVISMGGSLPVKPEIIEKEVISNAKRFGLDLNNLKVLHIENLEDSISQYRVDIKTEKLVKLQRKSISDVFDENANETKSKIG